MWCEVKEILHLVLTFVSGCLRMQDGWPLKHGELWRMHAVLLLGVISLHIPSIIFFNVRWWTSITAVLFMMWCCVWNDIHKWWTIPNEKYHFCALLAISLGSSLSTRWKIHLVHLWNCTFLVHAVISFYIDDNFSCSMWWRPLHMWTDSSYEQFFILREFIAIDELCNPHLGNYHQQ